MSPAAAFWRLAGSVLLGGCLGVFYGFLRPLGEKHRSLADVLFSLAQVWIWLYISFALCRGDIRIVYLVGMLSGCILWEKTFGCLLRPVFDGIWRFFRWVFRFFLLPWKKNFGFCKNFVCICGKMGYNKVYENLQSKSKAEEQIPWQTQTPRQKK